MPARESWRMQTAAPLAIPRATYRLQFHSEFTFRHATALLDYLDDLGISHVYASPLFTADKDSRHGYDVADHNRINPELGTDEEFCAYTDTLKARRMGQILDFVPNHMGIGPMNHWWMDVLENGPNSTHANSFDIDWQPLKAGLENRVLLPILGERYGRVLENGEFRLSCEKGGFFLWYWNTVLPLNLRTYPLILRRALAHCGEEVPPEARRELSDLIQSLLDLPTRHEVSDDARARRARGSIECKARLHHLVQTNPPVEASVTAAMNEFSGKPGDPSSFDAMDELLNGQVYRLSYWRVAAEQINYRRFFDVNSLAAIRTEVPEVFEAVHQLVFQMLERGEIHGLRIDHIDGLWDPASYLNQLQGRFAQKPEEKPLYLVVEKILGANEQLPKTWPVHGTTGYEFAVEATGVLIDPEGQDGLDKAYASIGGGEEFEDLVYEKKLLVTRLTLASEVASLVHLLERLAEQDRNYRDFTLEQLSAAVRELLACFPVYRSYVPPTGTASDEDRRIVTQAIRRARRRNPAIDWPVFQFLGRMLLLELREGMSPSEREEHVRFAEKFQQCSGPVMAKGVEDTAFYIYHRLVALNEVGGDPGRFGISVAEFHARCQRRMETHPHTMLATSTHDTKRSEDVRARIAAISELAGPWVRNVRHWARLNADKKTEVDGEMAPSSNEEYLLYQTLVGTWPLKSEEEGGHGEYVRRIQEYMVKALKEAKVTSSWVEPNEEWEKATTQFVARILDPTEGRKFLRSFKPFARQIAELGMINGLTQLVLKCTTPGVPDFYQGTEIWNLSLVDPDNRRTVDFEERRRLLASLSNASPLDLLQDWPSGRIKLAVTHRMIQLRKGHPEVFELGSYEPLECTGHHAQCVIAFARKTQRDAIVTIAPRLSNRMGFPAIGNAWRDTRVAVPPGEWSDAFTGQVLTSDGWLAVSDAMGEFPVAVIVRRGESKLSGES
jgi:(1->4)-alpha-D-glucan 1-alpha-D-glucosylmutase